MTKNNLRDNSLVANSSKKHSTTRSTKKLSAVTDLESVTALADSVNVVADMVDNEKLVAKTAKIQQVTSQASQSISTTNDVIHRIQRVPSGQALKSSSFVATNRNTNKGTDADALSPTEMLTALFKRSPSGLQFTLQAAGLPATTFSVINFQWEERYSDLYTLDIVTSSENPAIEPGTVLDNQAVLSVWQDGQLQQTFSGMVTDFEQGDSGFRRTHYRLRISPDLWRTTLRYNSRIFQQKDIQTILSTILSENSVSDYAFILRYPHPEREFCVQYQESDFDFFQRLTAEEGIFYYFEQQNGRHCLIMADDAAVLKGNVSLPYNLNRNAQLQEKCITSFNRSTRVRQSEVTLKDYTFKKPNWQATFNQSAGDTQAQRAIYEHYDYPGRFKDGRGDNYTRYRLDSLRQDAHLGWGESNSPNLYVGKIFTLQNHPNNSLNTEWQIAAIVYQGQQPQSAELEAGDKSTTLVNRFEFMPRHQTWRPLQRTKPRVDGPQIAIVTGPPGEEIYTDNFGRVRLQFLWDREGKFDDHSSCWIRVTQPWAGKGWGMMAIPRVGQEIVVDFLDGDPDQPIVTGRTYHANMPLPAELPGGKTQMHVMSQTYKGGGYNGMIMDDATGNQRLDFQAQKDMNTKVLNDQSNDVANNQDEKIGNNQSISVANDQSIKVANDQSTMIANDQSTSVNNNRFIEVKGNQALSVKGNRSIKVEAGDNSIDVAAGNSSEEVKQTKSTHAKIIQSEGDEQVALKVGSATIVIDKEAITLTFGSSTIQLNADGVFVQGTEIHLNK